MINCGALPESSLESELFGHEKGSAAGTGNSVKAGLFEVANHGTLFLDEIGDLVNYFNLLGAAEGRVVVSGLMDLKKARSLLERELIQKAVQICGSARNAAKVLGTDHSTIARKIKNSRYSPGRLE